MITFGFKNKVSGWLRAVIAIVIGALIVCSKHPEDALPLVVKVLASFLIAAGIISFIYGYVNRKRGVLNILTANAVIDVIVGIVLFCFPVQIANLMLILIGLVLLVCGIWEIVVLISAVKVAGVGFGAFILPVICVLAGLFVICHPISSRATLTVIAGISLLIYGISELLATWRMNKVMKQRAEKAETVSRNQEDMASAKETEYEKVD